MGGMTIEHDDTQGLIERVVGGDSDAFDILCRNHRAVVLGTITRMIGSGARTRIDPEDVLQDVLTTAWSQLRDFHWQGAGSFRRWLEGIARHRVLHLSRREQRRAELLELHRPVETEPSPSRGARRAERFERLKDAVDGLRPEFRDVLRLARLEGRSMREIAESMGRSESAVKNLLLRAMLALREVVPDTESLSLPKDRRLIDDRVEGQDRGSDDGS